MSANSFRFVATWAQRATDMQIYAADYEDTEDMESILLYMSTFEVDGDAWATCCCLLL